jgi:hypothetical protein
MGGIYQDAQIVEMVLGTCFEGINAR